MPRPKFESQVASFVAEGAAPSHLHHGGVVLRGQGGLFVTLVKPGSGLTIAGAYYQAHHGELQTQGLDLSQVPQREKNTEDVTIRGKKRATRTWDGMGFKFTKLGELFYRHIRRNYVVQVPVDVRGTRDNGTHYTFKTFFPITRLGLTEISLPLNLTESQRLERVKQMVLANVPANGVLYEQSRETYHVDPDGVWKISEESVHTNAAGPGTT